LQKNGNNVFLFYEKLASLSDEILLHLIVASFFGIDFYQCYFYVSLFLKALKVPSPLAGEG